MKQSARYFIIVVLVMWAAAAAPVVWAEEGVIGGVDAGAAVPLYRLGNRAHVGGTLSPFLGYMLNDFLGLVGQAQITGFPKNPDTSENDIWAFGAYAGPRLALPFHLGTGLGPSELYTTWQGGVFTGLTGNTPISRTSWGFSTGAGVNLRVTDELLVGAFGRYNWLDQRVESGHPVVPMDGYTLIAEPQNVQFVTAGLSLTYYVAPPPPAPPAPQVAEAPPPPAPTPPVARKIVLRGVHFDFNKATIRADARPVLDEAIATLTSEGRVAVVAEGHTDSKGSDAYNRKLSLRRAKAVRDYLVAGGLAPDRISYEGFGKSHPVASNDTADGRAQNRRVELRIRGLN
jgi:outer membrane protein OmpA-like peptidoglycan-associated protein